VPIDLKALGADYYITNCHKWLYAARGSAVLYVDKAHQGQVHPAHISWFYKEPSSFQDEFFTTGTMDYSPYMTIPAALQFRRELGEARIRNYMHNLAVQGGKYLAEKFGTLVLQTEEQTGSMVDVALPLTVELEDTRLTYEFWMTSLLDRFKLYAPPYKHNGRWWIRVSAQIYNDMTDFEKAGNVFTTLCNEINQGVNKNIQNNNV
jgi:selenocysteine lyase/cysteine desulfurase